MQKILIIGATSAIAEAVARHYASQGCRLYLTGRNAERLATIAADLRVRGAEAVFSQSIDMNAIHQHESLIRKVEDQLGFPDLVLVAHGTLPDQTACADSVPMTLQEFSTNALSTIALLTRLANGFEQHKRGTIAVISSVAGDRGRQSNYVYGSAKAAVTTFLQGLRNRLAKSQVQVLTIKPGFVDTPMTASFPKGPLWATPEQVAEDIVTAITKGRNVLYTPWFWRYIMLIIRHVPEVIFKRLSL